eukprot:m.57459 g.57459  ORF g.57459 m.57459 type:complete len:428 (+) comp22386_c0_seq1:313-1596(+)
MSLIHICLVGLVITSSVTSETVESRRKSLERMKKLLEIELELENLVAETPTTPTKVDIEPDTATAKSSNTTLVSEPKLSLNTAEVIPSTCVTTPIVSYLLGIRMQHEGIRIGHKINQCHPSSRMRDVESYQIGLAFLDNVHIWSLNKLSNQKPIAVATNNTREATQGLAAQEEVAMPNFEIPDTPFDILDVVSISALEFELDGSVPKSMVVTAPDTLSGAAASPSPTSSSDSNPLEARVTTNTASPPTTLTDTPTMLTDTSATPRNIVETKQAKINRMKQAIRAARVKAKKNGTLKTATVNPQQSQQQANTPQLEPVAVAARTPSKQVHTNDSKPVTAEPDNMNTNQTSAFTMALFGTIAIVVAAITTKLIKVNYKSGSGKSASSSRRSIPLAVIGEEQSWSFSTSSSIAASLRPRQSRKCSESLPL